MRLDQAVLDDYWTKGWTVVEDVYEREEADRIPDIASMAGDQEDEQCQATTRADRSANGRVVLMDVMADWR